MTFFTTAVLVVIIAIVGYIIRIGRWPESDVADSNPARNVRWANDFSLDATTPSGAAVFFRNSRGLNMHVRRFLPVGTSPLLGSVYMFHGWAEHLGRHMLTIRLLVDAGFEVIAVDHQGHGLSSGSIAFNVAHLVDDAAELIQTHQKGIGVKDRPQYIVCHSMGGLIGLSVVLREYANMRMDGIVLCGPLLFSDPRVATPFLVAVSGILSWLLPFAPVVPSVSEKIWHDTAIQKAYDDDPLVFHGGLPAMTGASFLVQIAWANAHLHRLTKPVLVLHGELDALCHLNGSRALLQHARSTDKALKIVPGGWHEILWLENTRHEVRSWLIAHVANTKHTE